MKYLTSGTQTYRHSNDDQRVKHSLGRLDTQTPSSRVLEQENVISTFKLPRTVCSVARIKLIETVPREQTIQILSNNIITIAFIHKQGGSTQQLDEIVKPVHQEAIDMNVSLVASYLSVVRNWKADQ